MLEPQYAVTTAPEDSDLFFGLPHDFLRLDSDQEPDTLELLLETAVNWAEAYTGRVLRLTGYTAQFPCFELANGTIRPYLKIMRSPLIDVTQVRVQEAAGQVTPAPIVVNKATYSEVFFEKGTEFDLDPDQDYPIQVDFRAGYSGPGAASPLRVLPNSVRAGIKQHVAFLFENRGDVGDDTEKGVPLIVKRSYDPILILKSFT